MVANAEHAKNDFAAVVANEHDLHATLAHNEQRVARIVFEQNDAAARITLLARGLSEPLKNARVESLEEGDGDKELRVGHRGEARGTREGCQSKKLRSEQREAGNARGAGDLGEIGFVERGKSPRVPRTLFLLSLLKAPRFAVLADTRSSGRYGFLPTLRLSQFIIALNTNPYAPIVSPRYIGLNEKSTTCPFSYCESTRFGRPTMSSPPSRRPETRRSRA